uniref:Endoglucanase n=1 Tax=Phallusia mammillata TaxID=59560 RepID=A0A6F9DSI0_9ASCI|nr:endoglucanase 19-like [Phallusia mammillata]
MNSIPLLLIAVLWCFVKSSYAAMDPVFFIENQPWQNETHVGYTGHFKIPVNAEFPSWWMGLIFEHRVTEFQIWQARYWKQSEDGTIVYIKETMWNGHQYPGGVLDQRYLVNYEKREGVDYAEEPAERPVIVFRYKVYTPHPNILTETPMTVALVEDYYLPENFEMSPIETIATKAPVTLPPLTRGPNSGPFWWVRTLAPPVTERVNMAARTTTVSTSTTPTTLEPKPTEFVMPCNQGIPIRQRRCRNQNLTTEQCYIPRCSNYNPGLYSVVQCWSFKKICWCADTRSGKRIHSHVVRLKHMSRLPCLGGKPQTTPTAIATTKAAGLPTLPTGEEPLQRPVFAPRNNYNYNLVIHNSLLFFEAQRSGNIGSNSRIKWRRSAHTSDGLDCGSLDLAGGYYLSGDYVKFGLPTASAITMLAWGFLEFPNSYTDASETQFLKDALKWGTDFFIKAHTSKYTLVGQVGNAAVENSHWLKPQDMTVNRPCYSISNRSPGSDLAAETAAALAATAKVWLQTGSATNDKYVQTLIGHARDLYDFATKFRGIYSNYMRAAHDYYPSKGYGDEITWAALWLYEATGEVRYLADATSYYKEFELSGKPGEVSWEHKVVPVEVLLARYAARSGVTTAGQAYLNSVTKFCDYKLPGGGSAYTPQGLMYANEWGSNRYAVNSAFVCIVASTLPTLDNDRKQKYRKFAEDQLDYILGKTGKSFVIGYGNPYPTQPHHRASSCSLAGSCGWDSFHSTAPNPQLLIGAMVGGPDQLDVWTNDRTDFKSNGVSLDYNAGLQGASAGLRHFQLEYNTWLLEQTHKRNQ